MCGIHFQRFNFLSMNLLLVWRLKGLFKGWSRKNSQGTKKRSPRWRTSLRLPFRISSLLTSKDPRNSKKSNGVFWNKQRDEGVIWWQHIHRNNSSSVAWIYQYMHAYIPTIPTIPYITLHYSAYIQYIPYINISHVSTCKYQYQYMYIRIYIYISICLGT